MYFTDISNKELQNFHEQVKLSFNINLQDVLNNPLFHVTVNDNLLQVSPLFYAETIESDNPIDKVLENRSIICENTPNTTLFFTTNDKIPVLSLNYSYYTDNKNYYVFYMYDKGTGKYLTDVTANIVFYSNNQKSNPVQVKSDKKGVIYIDTSKRIFDKIEITFNTTDAETTYTWEA